MAPTKTPGSTNVPASDTFLKKQAEAKGLGADNAPAHKDAPAPGEAPVASDSGIIKSGMDTNATNVPGEKGLKDVPVSEERNSEMNGNTMT
ncbi:hypothetical protein PG993_007870 [Apiospora rasikravindrae]|uniref:Uncharacterized protein n=1 Tax=Apiospora rasikravindrae TaxID=990691 RepID=A0ABR1SYQ6_9PEZI